VRRSGSPPKATTRVAASRMADQGGSMSVTALGIVIPRNKLSCHLTETSTSAASPSAALLRLDATAPRRYGLSSLPWARHWHDAIRHLDTSLLTTKPVERDA
jgi:hypothetical protein